MRRFRLKPGEAEPSDRTERITEFGADASGRNLSELLGNKLEGRRLSQNPIKELKMVAAHIFRPIDDGDFVIPSFAELKVGGAIAEMEHRLRVVRNLDVEAAFYRRLGYLSVVVGLASQIFEEDLE
jgi:hypothetical protein